MNEKFNKIKWNFISNKEEVLNYLEINSLALYI